MAIKIPSKNIYEINNPKIRDNVIDNVSVEQTVVTPNNEYSVTVLSKDEHISSSSLGQNQEYTNAKAYEVYHSTQAGTEDYIRAKIAYSRCFDKKISIFTVKVPLIQKNKYVSELIIGKNKENDTNNIGVALYGYQNHYIANSTWNCEMIGTQIGGYTTPIITKKPINYTIIDDNSKKPPTTISLPTEIVANVEDSGLPNVDVSSKIEINDEGNLSTAKYTIKKENDIEYYELTLQIMHSFNVETMAGADGSSGQNTNVYLSGERIDYVAQSLQITIQGNTIGIDLTDGSVNYGNGKKPHSLSGNELLQDSAYKKTNAILNITNIVETASNFNYDKVYFDNVNINGELNYDLPIYIQGDNVNYYQLNSDILGNFIFATKGIFPTFAVGDTINVFQKNPLTKIIAENVLRQYANGKETATLLCDIADYYDESGEKVIDIKTENMSFRLHDKVIPYVFGANGQDQPMSKHQDGSPKVFEVTGSNIIYDGAVWQELTLLEKKQ